jgi:hypothetical protein
VGGRVAVGERRAGRRRWTSAEQADGRVGCRERAVGELVAASERWAGGLAVASERAVGGLAGGERAVGGLASDGRRASGGLASGVGQAPDMWAWWLGERVVGERHASDRAVSS